MGVVLPALLQAGYRTPLPFGDGHPYDLAFDQNGELRRVQCKTGRMMNEAVYFPTSIWCRDSKWRPYRDDGDYFGVYCPDTDAVYLVPISDLRCPGSRGVPVVNPTKNNQAKGVRWAKDYVLGGKVKVAAVGG
jgi:hypothetical protein